jgi:hypothetical protein
MTSPLKLKPLRFNGPAYEPEHDQARLTGQLARVWTVTRDQQWRTAPEIGAVTGDPDASVSAQLRHLRKRRFGAHVLEKRLTHDPERARWEYRLLPADPEDVA